MRKVLSFVLVLTLVLSSFSMAFAATPGGANLSDIAGNANVDAIQVAYDLSIVTGNPDGTFLPEKAVTRAEFAAMITRALAIPDSALAGYTSTTFKDTTGYGWAVPYLAFAQSKGIMLGDGAGNVMPGRTITVNEAMTMALRAIGYTANSSLLVGAWPANYVSIAQNESLYDDVASSTTVNKASAAQIIYNMLTVQKVAVNTDGDTVFQTIRDKDAELGYIEANLLNTNLGCTAVPKEILGDSFTYNNSLINITGKLGAYGTAYKNKDGDLVAFTVDSTALAGKIDGDKFKVGDTKYDLPTSNVTVPAIFANTVDKGSATGAADVVISNAAVYADGTNVIINADVSGKKIKEVYSVVAWKADDAALADSDIQEDIEDQNILGIKFALTDDDELDFKSFQLEGVASLDKIVKDDVLYVYKDGSNKIRKVAVGTETVEGTIEEIGKDYITIGGKDYKFPPSELIGTAKVGDFDVDDEGTFYLDYAGKVFKFEGSSGSTDTFGIVQGSNFATVDENIDSAKVKLYLSDDSEKTFYFAKKLNKIDWVTGAANTTTTSAVTGALVGYSLNANGDIDTLNVSAVTSGIVDFQSAKVLKVGASGVSKTIDSSAVVFTYKNSTTATGDYDVAKLSEVEKGSIATSASPASIIYNKDGKVVALFIEASFVDVDEDDVYGVFNTRVAAKTGDDNVYRFTGFIDGAEFNKKTDDRASAFDNKAGKFGVYKITVDANDVITDVASIENAVTRKATGVDGVSGNVIGANTSAVIYAISSDRTVVTANVDGGPQYTIADDAVVYKYDADEDEYTLSKVTSLRKGYTVSLYDTKGKDSNGIASVVIYIED